MNSLSWLIYFGGASESASNFFSFLSAVGAIIAILGFVFTIIWSDSSREEVRKKYEGFNTRGHAMWPKGLAMLVGFGLVATVLPSRGTVYAIAASEVGEQIVKSEVASDASKALQAWIKKQIEPEAKK